MKYSSRRISIHSFLTLGSYEEEKEFREVLKSLSQRGIFIAGLLGAITVSLYIFAHVIYNDRVILWSYSHINPQRDMVLYDKGLILIMCLAAIIASRTPFSLFTDRLIVGIIVWSASLAMLMDDLAGGDVSVSPMYISFALILAVAALPYRGWHTALLDFSVITSIYLGVHYLPELFGWPPTQLSPSQLIYLVMLAVVLTGMSSQLYLNRYEQYRERRRAEELTSQLEERAEKLQKLKDKSDAQARQLLEAEQLKDRFFANISHEFRTPLTVLLGPLKDMLEEQEDRKPPGRQLLQLMYSNGRRLLDLINQLLDLSKFDAGQIRLNPQEINLSDLVRETTYSFAPLAEARKVKLSCRFNSPNLVACVDAQQIERVIGNLVSNAIKFTDEGGIVELSLSQQDSTVHIVIRDDGIGIHKDQLPYIFDRFYQAAQTGDRLNPGTGIGLALAKEIVELHGGEISVESRVGSGSEFAIVLPAEEDKMISPEETQSPSMESKTESLLFAEAGYKSKSDEEFSRGEEDAPVVLLVDDNPDILTYLRPHLGERYKVQALENSSEALEVIRNNSVDLLISDVRMPDPDGFELCRIIKESDEWNHIPVILLTAQASEESRIEGLELGADDYISKPFSASELLIRAENLIELRRTLREKYSDQVLLKGKNIDVTSEDARFLQQVQQVIEKHMGNSNFGVEWLADEVNISARQLQRKLRSITNLSAGGYVRMMRLERAGQLLEQDWGNVSEVAYKVGFQDPKYFSRLFKQTFGATPTEYTERRQ
ncbi:MAG: response regulator [Balneolaceae bacterium]|nr:response regulator [Balneolaceae bacterium]